MTEIPTNCVFNKGVTGCGATTLAIKQPGHTILALPFVGLVENKAASNPELLAIHGGLGKPLERQKMIERYISTHKTIKIAATYDCVPSVCEALINLGLDPYQDFFLFVDEWHVLFNSYGYRDAVKTLLECSKLFTRKTFVSATPIPRAYWLKELADLPEYKLI